MSLFPFWSSLPGYCYIHVDCVISECAHAWVLTIHTFQQLASEASRGSDLSPLISSRTLSTKFRSARISSERGGHFPLQRLTQAMRGWMERQGHEGNHNLRVAFGGLLSQKEPIHN